MAKGKHGPAPGASRSSLTLHPNSRRVARLTSKEQRRSKLDQRIKSGNARLQATGEKLVWFKDNLTLVLDESEVKLLSRSQMLTLLEAFLTRFHEELEQIRLKKAIGNRRGHQHLSRLQLIEATMKRETEEFCGCGLEVPDLLDQGNFERFLEWNGELRFVQNIELKRIRKKDLLEGKEGDQKNQSPEGMNAD